MKHKTIEKSSSIVANFQKQFGQFEESLNGGRQLAFHQTRKNAIEKFAATGLPSTRNEEWKYTNIAPMFKENYLMPSAVTELAPEEIEQYKYKAQKGPLLVFVNGIFSEKLSSVEQQAGVLIRNMKDALGEADSSVASHIGKYIADMDDPFVALNTAFTSQGTFIEIESGVQLEDPIHILNVSTANGGRFSATPRTLIICGENSEAHIIESYHAAAGSEYLNNAVTEILVAKNANLEHVKIQEESLKSCHIASTTVRQQRDSRFSSVSIDLGGALVRNNLNIHLDDENCEANLYGFFLGTGNRLIDNHTFIDHANPHCESNELYKGILDDRSKGVFNGKVMVRPDAQKTNAFQENKCLLLTADAAMNAKPQLEIFADDVKCSHGATVGQLDADALFYLRSRGVNQENANSLLRYAFASDVFQKIKIGAVREKLEAIVFAHFGN